ncbi:MAG: CPBP family intramembrane glutamic endopeptidase [Eubacteriales bacterium]|nr:CPBP family intramembrane glutamic endopeptidase [Eubacteriales bacterium]
MEHSEKRAIRVALIVLLVFLALFLVQEFVGKAANAVADAFAYGTVDPDDTFAWQSVHHLVLLAAGLILAALLGRLMRLDFGFHLGDRKTGLRWTVWFTVVMTAVSLLYHISLLLRGQSMTYDFPLNARNVFGTLGFQLLLSGPAEEILYRAIPVTLFLCALRKSIHIKWGVTLEIVLASLLFSFAHVKWSLSPFAIDASVQQLIYAFAIGTVQGVAYQKSRSVLYPILMHSASNVLMVGLGYLFSIVS